MLSLISHTHPKAFQGTTLCDLSYAQVSCPDFTNLESLYFFSCLVALIVSSHSVIWRRYPSTPGLPPLWTAFESCFHFSHLLFFIIAFESSSPSDFIPDCSSVSVYLSLSKVSGSVVVPLEAICRFTDFSPSSYLNHCLGFLPKGNLTVLFIFIFFFSFVFYKNNKRLWLLRI